MAIAIAAVCIGSVLILRSRPQVPQATGVRVSTANSSTAQTASTGLRPSTKTSSITSVPEVVTTLPTALTCAEDLLVAKNAETSVVPDEFFGLAGYAGAWRDATGTRACLGLVEPTTDQIQRAAAAGFHVRSVANRLSYLDRLELTAASAIAAAGLDPKTPATGWEVKVNLNSVVVRVSPDTAEPVARALSGFTGVIVPAETPTMKTTY